MPRVPLRPLAVALSLAAGAAFTSGSAPVIGAEPVHAASLDPARWSGDARFLVAAIDSLHPRPFHLYRRAAWDSAAEDLERRLPSLRYDQAVAGFSRLVGMLHDGHSRLDQIRLPSHGRPTLKPLPGPGFDTAYPLDFEVFADGLRIVRATRAHRDLLGARVVAIGGQPTARAVAALTPLVPADNAMWGLYVLPMLLRCPGYVDAAGLADGPTAPLRLAIVDASGRTRDVAVPPARPDSAARWLAADHDVRAPLPLTRRLPRPFAFADLGDSAHTVFVRIRQIVNVRGGETFAAFTARMFAHVDSVRARRLILDLRRNGGGDNYLNQPLVQGVIRRPALDRTGALFVIVDRGTFSAAVNLATDLERETYAVFVGEPTGGAPNSSGDPKDVTLPASRLVVRISTLYWQSSDPRDPRAFIPPDLPVMPTWADWIAHRDPALEAIEAYRAPVTADELPPNTHWARRAKLEAKPPTIAW